MGFLKYIVQGAGWELGRGLMKDAKEEAAVGSAEKVEEEPIPSAQELAAQRTKLERLERLRSEIEAKKTKLRKAEERRSAVRELALLKKKMHG